MIPRPPCLSTGGSPIVVLVSLWIISPCRAFILYPFLGAAVPNDLRRVCIGMRPTFPASASGDRPRQRGGDRWEVGQPDQVAGRGRSHEPSQRCRPRGGQTGWPPGVLPGRGWPERGRGCVPVGSTVAVGPPLVRLTVPLTREDAPGSTSGNPSYSFPYHFEGTVRGVACLPSGRVAAIAVDHQARPRLAERGCPCWWTAHKLDRSYTLGALSDGCAGVAQFLFQESPWSVNGAGGGGRTLTPFRAGDFKSPASAISPPRHGLPARVYGSRRGRAFERPDTSGSGVH